MLGLFEDHAGFERVQSCNPNWDNPGHTFEDADGLRVVLQRAALRDAA